MFENIEDLENNYKLNNVIDEINKKYNNKIIKGIKN